MQQQQQQQQQQQGYSGGGVQGYSGQSRQGQAVHDNLQGQCHCLMAEGVVVTHLSFHRFGWVEILPKR